MARPKNPDRTSVADQTLTVRFSAPEIARLGVLLAQRVAALHGTGAKLNAGGLVRAIVVHELDALGIEVPPGTPMQPALPGLAPAPSPPDQGGPATAPSPPAAFWYGISDAGSSTEWIQPRQASRDEMEAACRKAGVSLRGPFTTRQDAWTAFDREREEKEKAPAVAPPPPAPAAATATPSSSPAPKAAAPKAAAPKAAAPKAAAPKRKAKTEPATARRASKPADRTKKSAGKKPRR